MAKLIDTIIATKIENIFTKIDPRNAYHRLRVKEGDEYKLLFAAATATTTTKFAPLSLEMLQQRFGLS